MVATLSRSDHTGLRLLEKEIGIENKESPNRPDVPPIFRFESAWGKVPRPRYRCDILEQKSSADVTFLSNPYTVSKKFFWPQMTNGTEPEEYTASYSL